MNRSFFSRNSFFCWVILSITSLSAVDREEDLLPTLFPFMGETTTSKVRLRLSPHILEDNIFRELFREEPLIILGEEEEFYRVLPPHGEKGYVFRTYLLDGYVQGENVNLRIAPDLHARIITQVGRGEYLRGKIASQDYRWMEVNLPSTFFFYVAKGFIARRGDVREVSAFQEKSMLLEEERKKLALYATGGNKKGEELSSLYEELIGRAHFHPFLREQIIQDQVLFREAWQKRETSLPKQEENEEEKMEKSSWEEKEERLFCQWLSDHPKGSWEQFYECQRAEGEILSGRIALYYKELTEKPGDFLLLNEQGRAIAYLYSNQIHLEEKVGELVCLLGARRPNYGFALPAYYALREL